MKKPYLIALFCLIVGNSAYGKSVATNAAANLALGQSDFITGTAAPVVSSFSLSGPYGVAVDPTSGKVFVTDRSNNRILRYPNKASLSNGAGAEAVFGQARFSSSTSGSGELNFSGPRGIFVDKKGRLWVADASNNRVLMFEAASYRGNQPFPDRVFGQPDFTTTSSSTSSTKFSFPDSICVDSNDRLWVADEGNNRVLRFDSVSSKGNGAAADGVLGQALFTTSASGSGSSGLQTPVGVAMSDTGTLFVACYSANRIMAFNNAASAGNGAGANFVLGQANFTDVTGGLSATQFASPSGLCVAKDDTLWLCDFGNTRFLRFDKASTKSSGAAADAVVGQPDFVTSSSDTTARKVSSPFLQVHVDDSGDLWVADRGNNRVLRFPGDGTKPQLAVTTTIPGSTPLAKFTIKGTASDSSGIARIQYKVNNGVLKTATGTTSWQFKANLASGDNKITIFAVDGANNQSVGKVVKIRRTSGVAPFLVVGAP